MEYVDIVNEGRFDGFIYLTENGLPAQIPVTIKLIFSEENLELVMKNDGQDLYSAIHAYKCRLIEEDTLPYIEILDGDDNVVGCISGLAPIINYDLEVVPNANGTSASLVL